MEKRTKDRFKRQLSEAIDPRFSDIFKTGVVGNTFKQPENGSKPIVSRDTGFQEFISGKLTDFLDKNIKEVDRPVVKSEIFSNQIAAIRLFSDSDLITDLEVEETTAKKPKKKKHKKQKSFEDKSIKEVVVTADWLKRQAEILNS